jgi:hypothetical protein
VTAGAWVLVAALAAALAFGLYRALTDGRFRGTHRVRHVDDEPAPVIDDESVWAAVSLALPDAEAGERATLVQFSSAFCAPCRATRRVLADVSDLVDGVRHLEIDAEHHLPLVRELGIRRTPTTLVLAADGHELSRAAGVPTKAQVVAALAP